MSGQMQQDPRFPLEDGEEPDELQHDLRRILVATTWLLVGFIGLALVPLLVVAFQEGGRVGLWWAGLVVPLVSVTLAIPVATLLGLAWVSAGFGRPGARRAPGRMTCAVSLASLALLLLILEILLIGTIVGLNLLA